MLTIFSLPYCRPFSCTDAANLSQEIEPAPTPILLSASAFQSFMSSPLRTIRQSLPEPTPAIPTSDLAPWPSAREMSCGPNAVSWMSPEASAVRASAKRWNITISICMLYFAAYSGSSHRGDSAGTLSMPCFTVTAAGSRALRASPCASATDGAAPARKSRAQVQRIRGRTCKVIGISQRQEIQYGQSCAGRTKQVKCDGWSLGKKRSTPAGFQLLLDRDDGDRQCRNRRERCLRSPAHSEKSQHQRDSGAEGTHGDGPHAHHPSEENISQHEEGHAA